MDKKLKKKVEAQIVSAIEGVLSRMNKIALDHSKKKIKEAGKMVAKRFTKAIEDGKNSGVAKKNKTGSKKPFKKPVMPKRDANGKFTKKK